MIASRLGLAALFAAAAVASVSAQPADPLVPPAVTGPTVMVLRLDSGPGVDRGLIEGVQQAIEAQAGRSGLTVSTGGANLADTAAVTGCTSKVPADCRDQIIETLGVDELVYGTVERSISGHSVTVVRARLGAPPLVVTVEVPAGDVTGAVKATHPTIDGLFPVVGDGTGTGTGTVVEPGAGTAAGTGATGPEPVVPGAVIPPSGGPRDDGPTIPRKVVVGGMIAGSALAVTGVLLWFKASSMQGEIDDAPVSTPEEIFALRDLEDSAASYASWGNRLFAVGLVVGGASAAYWLFKGRGEAPAAPARGATVSPWIAPDAGGIVVSWSTP